MATPNQTAAPDDSSDWDIITQSFQDLLDELHTAYWSGSSVAAKDQITQITHNVSDILTTLYQGKLTKNTIEYKALNLKIDSINSDLINFQKAINDFVSDIKIATQVINAITQTVAECAKLFA